LHKLKHFTKQAYMLVEKYVSFLIATFIHLQCLLIWQVSYAVIPFLRVKNQYLLLCYKSFVGKLQVILLR